MVLEDAQLPLEQKKRKILRNLAPWSRPAASPRATSTRTSSTKYQRHPLPETLTAEEEGGAGETAADADSAQLQGGLLPGPRPTTTTRTSRPAWTTSQEELAEVHQGEEKGSKKLKQQSLKYNGARSTKKGVGMEIEGLQANQFKNVIFISRTCSSYSNDGGRRHEVFDKAKVNVNLLVFLLNKKFYGK
ncbi:unnamed protein product [Boreogadus saida]